MTGVTVTPVSRLSRLLQNRKREDRPMSWFWVVVKYWFLLDLACLAVFLEETTRLNRRDALIKRR